MWELDCEESRVLKNWCFWTVVLEKTLEISLDCKEIQPVNPKWDQSWVFIGGTDVEAELQYFGHLMWRVDSLEETMMLGGIGGRRRRGQQRMRWLDSIINSMHMNFRWSPGVGDGKRGPVCCDSWGRKESNTTERLKWTELNWKCTEFICVRNYTLPGASDTDVSLTVPGPIGFPNSCRKEQRKCSVL